MTDGAHTFSFSAGGKCMRRSQVVKTIFWELRAAGVEGSAKDVLRLAHFIVQSHAGEVGRLDDFGRVVDSRALPHLPVDLVMSDGGWRLLEFERSRAVDHDPDAAERYSTRSRVRKLIGSLWPR